MSDRNDTDTVARAAASLRSVGDAARQVGENAQQTGSKAKSDAQDLAQEAKQRGGAVASEIGERLETAAETQKEHFADQLEDIAKAVHRSGEQLEGHQDWAARLVERGAAELSTLANSLRGNDMRGLLGSLQDVAQRQPALFAGASMATGFALARVGRVAVAGASKEDLPTMPALT